MRAMHRALLQACGVEVTAKSMYHKYMDEQSHPECGALSGSTAARKTAELLE